MHKEIEPSILYFGTPVVLISTNNEDGSVNVAPISSIWWLGWSAMIGLDATSKTTENLIRTGECVLNLPSSDIVDAVNRIALTTGSKKLPLHKRALGYAYVKDKLSRANLTVEDSKAITPPRIRECQVQMEAQLANMYPFAVNDEKMAVPSCAIELEIKKIYADEEILKGQRKGYVDPDKWHPLIMSFRKYYTTYDSIHPSRLNSGSEDAYAPWKLKGAKKITTNFLLKILYRKYRLKQKEEDGILN